MERLFKDKESERLFSSLKLQRQLVRLGVHSIEQLLALPASDVADRLGSEAYLLYCHARGNVTNKAFKGSDVAPEYFETSLSLDYGVQDFNQLCSHLENSLIVLAQRLDEGGYVARKLEFTFDFRHAF